MSYHTRLNNSVTSAGVHVPNSHSTIFSCCMVYILNKWITNDNYFILQKAQQIGSISLAQKITAMSLTGFGASNYIYNSILVWKSSSRSMLSVSKHVKLYHLVCIPCVFHQFFVMHTLKGFWRMCRVSQSQLWTKALILSQTAFLQICSSNIRISYLDFLVSTSIKQQQNN